MNHQPERITRREALRRAAYVLGGALSAPTVAGVLAGCKTSPRDRDDGAGGETWVPRTLSTDQGEMILIMGEYVIPETDTPGARAARVDQFIDVMLTDYYPAERSQRFLAGLDRVDAHARSRFGVRFLDASPEQQLELVEALNHAAFQQDEDRGRDAFFRTFKELVVVGYYTSEVGATEELLQETAEAPDERPGEGREEALDRMGGGHLIGLHLDDRSTAGLCSERVEVRQVTAGAVEEKAEHLLKEHAHRQALPALAHRAEEALETIHDVDVSEVAREEDHPGAAGEVLVGNADPVNCCGRILAIAAGICHTDKHPLGDLLERSFHYAKLPKTSDFTQRVFYV